MSSRRRLVARRGRWSVLVPSVLVVCACNAVSGVNDLEFGDPPAPPAEAGNTPGANGETVGVAPLETCDPLTGSGCAADQTCRLSRTRSEPSCTPSPAQPLAPYAACREDGECPAAHLCAAGVCSRLCTSAADCGWSSARCLLDDSGLFSRCTRNCDLVTRDAPRSGLQACGAGARCDFVAESGGAGFTDCVPATGGSFDGAPCEDDAACPAGFLCQRQRCAAACDPGGAACANGGSCSEVSSLAGQSVGACCSIPAGQACNLLTSCGCAGGQACSAPDATGATACRALPANPAGAYASCSEDGECPGGHACIDGACKRYCRTLADCGEDGIACISILQGGVQVPDVSVCARGCDLLAPGASDTGFRGCGAQANCFLGSGITDCASAGAGVQGSACEANEDCSAGFLCYRNVCERWCDPSASVCEAGTFCGGIINAAGRQLGSCCRPPAGQVCDWVTDCGCSASETCARDADGVRSCRTVAAATVAPYAACSEDVECPRGYNCVNGNCMQRCSASSDCGAGIAIQCIPLITNVVETQSSGICARNCDVLSANAPAAGFQPCAAGLACTDVNGPEGGGSICTVPGPGGVGDACTTFTDCGAALDCDQGQCLALCELGTTCGNGASCQVRAIDIGPVNGRSIGVCPLNG